MLFSAQPDYDATPLPTTPGIYVFYLDVWLRHLTVAERDSIREVALGGPDTTTRTKTIWQVKYFKAPLPVGSPPSTYHCLSPLPSEVTQATTGSMSARSELDTGTADPCGLVASGGYKRLENQLYRVEVHNAGDRSVATFKWSRDNGSVIARWEAQDPTDKNKLTVSSLGKDEILSFKTGDWIELINDSTDLLNKPGILAQLLTAEDNVLVLDPVSIKYPPGVSKVEIGNKNPRVRRWDSAGDLKMNAGASWVALEDGVEVRFETGSYKTGDYWTIPARTAKADIEWPFMSPQPPQGIQHHFAKLGILELRGPSAGAGGPGWYSMSDCRPLFPAITELTSLFYLGGDGQGAKPGELLPDALMAGVANGEWPVKNARIRFSVIAGGGSFDDGTTTYTTTTGANGAAISKKWKLGNNGTQQVSATLLDAAGDAMHLQLRYSATVNLAANIAYDGGDCNLWPAKRPTNVAEALTALCKRTSSGGGGCSVTVGKTGQYATLKDAFAALKDELIISICMKPQEEPHIIDGVNVTGKSSVRISGNGCYLQMNEDKFSIAAGQVILEDLIVYTAAYKGRIIINSRSSVTSNCSFTRQYGDTANTPYISLGSIPPGVFNIDGGTGDTSNTIHWEGNRIQANVALTFNEQIRGYFTKNHVLGTTYLQYSDKIVEANFPSLNESQRKRFEDALPASTFIVFADMLHLKENIFDRVISNSVNTIYSASGLPGTQLRGYFHLHICDNLFNWNANSFVAIDVTLKNNHFKVYANAIDCYVLAHAAVISGNILATNNSRIESLVDTGRKAVFGNIGPVV